MAFEHEQRQALRLLQGIENASLNSSELGSLIEEADPALVYFICTWLRDHYGAGHPAAEGVLGRLLELTQGHSTIKAKMREGKADPVVAWFEEAHTYREFPEREFIELIVEKLEG